MSDNLYTTPKAPLLPSGATRPPIFVAVAVLLLVLVANNIVFKGIGFVLSITFEAIYEVAVLNLLWLLSTGVLVGSLLARRYQVGMSHLPRLATAVLSVAVCLLFIVGYLKYGSSVSRDFSDAAFLGFLYKAGAALFVALSMIFFFTLWLGESLTLDLMRSKI